MKKKEEEKKEKKEKINLAITSCRTENLSKFLS
jgi:hypothetical protein